MFNDIDWTKNGNSFWWIYFEFQTSKWLRSRVSARTLVIPRSWKWGTWYGTHAHKQDGKWEKQANQMIDQFQQSGHPIFRGTIALDRGVLKRKSGRNTTHFPPDSGKIELMLRDDSLNKSVQHPRSSVEMVHRFGWKDAWSSSIYGSGQNHFYRKWSAHKTAGSARSWFLGTKPANDRRSRGKLLARSLATIRNDESRWTTLHRQVKEQDS